MVRHITPGRRGPTQQHLVVVNADRERNSHLRHGQNLRLRIGCHIRVKGRGGDVACQDERWRSGNVIGS